MKTWRPLRGVRVLSFELAFSLPAATRVLADLGAEVVRVCRPGGNFSDYVNTMDGNGINKHAITIDLHTEAGRALALQLTERADVVCSNYRAPVMEGFGLDPVALRERRRDLILLRVSGYGVPGPWQDFPAYGPSTEAAGGMNAAMGTSEDPPMRVGSGVFADQLSGRYAALALLAALDRRQRTGEGSTIDRSMTEAVSHLLGDQLLFAARHGHAPSRIGNRHATAAPYGIYRCAGKDDWVAISVFTTTRWRSLSELLDDGELRTPELDDAAARQNEQDRIDSAITRWSAQHSKEVQHSQQLDLPCPRFPRHIACEWWPGGRLHCPPSLGDRAGLIRQSWILLRLARHPSPGDHHHRRAEDRPGHGEPLHKSNDVGGAQIRLRPAIGKPVPVILSDAGTTVRRMPVLHPDNVLVKRGVEMLDTFHAGRGRLARRRAGDMRSGPAPVIDQAPLLSNSVPPTIASVFVIAPYPPAAVPACSASTIRLRVNS
ncbi:MAG: CoA transferase [Dehalococcoidia bacterium]